MTLTNAVILQAGEKLSDESVVARSGSWVVTALHFVYEIWRYTKHDDIDGTSMVGGPSEIAEKIRIAENNGLKEVSLLPPLPHIREMAKDFAEKVIPLC